MMYRQLCCEFYDADKKYASFEEVDFYQKFFNKNDLILEPMCGSGRLLLPLMQKGYLIHGIDNSPAMLQSCKERAAQLHLAPTLFEGSIENMQLSNQYDGIIIPLGSFQLLCPRLLAFQALVVFKKHLKPGGKLIMDLFVPWDALYENNEEEHSTRAIVTNNGAVIKATFDNQVNKYEQWIVSKTRYSKFIQEKIVAEEDEQIMLCWYYRYEMELILEKYGFKNIRCETRSLNNTDYMTFIAEC